MTGRGTRGVPCVAPFAVSRVGTASYRKALLRSGVELHELKPAAGVRVAGSDSGIGGSSRASLHAKTLVADRKRVFVGSFNLDPRSARLNTEMGLVFDNAAAGGALAQGIERAIAQRAYEVKLASPESGDEIEWVERAPNRRHVTEPETSAWRRLGAWFLSLLPVERHL